jgi:hypothetical protein
MKKTRILYILFIITFAVYLSPVQAQDQGGRPLTAQLSGNNVVPGPGDNDGTGTANITLNPGKGEITYEISVSNVDNITGIHIHKADSGSTGPVVVPFTSSGELSGTVTGIDKGIITDILKNPSGYYVQVHSADFPAGAIRGQLSKK